MKSLITVVFSSIFICCIFSCCESPPESVLVTFPGEQEFRTVLGNKNNLEWEASPFLKKSTVDNSLFILTLNSYDIDGFVKENLVFGFVDTVSQAFDVYHTYIIGNLTTFYSTLREAGDVIEDSYLLDETHENKLIVTNYDSDLVKLTGTFTVRFQHSDFLNRVNSLNPEFILFDDVHFEVTIK